MTDATQPEIEIVSAETDVRVILRGPLTLHQVTGLEADLAALPADRTVQVDLSGVTRFDTAAAWALTRLRARLDASGGSLAITGAGQGPESLLRTVSDALPDPVEEPPKRFNLADDLAELGEAVAGGLRFLGALLGYLGLFLARMGRALIRPREFPLTSLAHHCEEVGFRAIPIVSVMAFLIGVVLAFQGATQLRQFGAEVFVVDLIAISILRELGILLTSIIVAGRTASSFTAAIGSMKMREEIDAMKSLGLDPAMMLFVPRILALIITLPILGMIANLMGLLGGLLMAWVELGISPAMFSTRLVDGTDISHAVVGMVKAPVFALIIGVVGCHAGMQVKSNAESLGRMTSAAVVTAIFAVILADAAFSVFFAQIGV